MCEKMIRLRLSIQNALIGRVTSELRGVYAKINNYNIFIIFVIETKSDYWDEVSYEIGSEIIADFDKEYTIDENLIISNSLFLDFKDYLCVYKRYEESLE